jgi:hypothetical protein
MIKNWLGEIDEKILETLIDSTEGYSGAHMWELIEFAKSIAEDEDIDVKDAIIRSLEKLNDQKDLINTIRSKGIEDSETKDLDILLSKITEDNIHKEFELEIEEKEFPIEIETKEIEFTDEEIASVVTKLLEEKSNIDINDLVNESILKLKGRMF